MRFIILSLFVLASGYTLPRHNSLTVRKSKCFKDEFKYLQNKIKKFENIKNKMLILTNQNLKTIKDIIEEDIIEEEYSTEWDYYNETWVENN